MDAGFATELLKAMIFQAIALTAPLLVVTLALTELVPTVAIRLIQFVGLLAPCRTRLPEQISVALVLLRTIAWSWIGLRKTKLNTALIEESWLVLN